MLAKTKLKLASAVLLAGISASSYAVWQNAQTTVYYTDASKTQVAGYIMHYCQSMVRNLVGTKTAYVETKVGGSCESGAMPPSPY